MSRHIKRGDAGLVVTPAGLDEESSRDAVVMPDTILAKVELKRSVWRNRHCVFCQIGCNISLRQSRIGASSPLNTLGYSVERGQLT